MVCLCLQRLIMMFISLVDTKKRLTLLKILSLKNHHPSMMQLSSACVVLGETHSTYQETKLYQMLQLTDYI